MNGTKGQPITADTPRVLCGSRAARDLRASLRLARQDAMDRLACEAGEARYRRAVARAAVEPAIRRAVYAELRRLGYRREIVTGSGSVYYQRGGDAEDVVRISDHEVPLTDERAAAGFNWAEHGRTIRIDRIETVAGGTAAVAEAIG